MLWSQKIAIFFVPNDCSYGQLTKIQKFYLSPRLWSNRERLLAFQLLNLRESKFRDICGVKCLGIIISLLLKNNRMGPLAQDASRACGEEPAGGGFYIHPYIFRTESPRRSTVSWPVSLIIKIFPSVVPICCIYSFLGHISQPLCEFTLSYKCANLCILQDQQNFLELFYVNHIFIFHIYSQS
jgi:hypothetical protein